MRELGFLSRLMKRFSGGFVLAFHEIPPHRLSMLVESLSLCRVVSLSDLVQRTTDGKSTSGLFAITVDDGVGENVRSLADVCLARRWPATFYLPTRYIDTGEGMAFQWWRRLQPLLPRRRLELRSGTLDLSRPGAVRRLSRQMESQWHSQRPDSYLPMLMELVEMVSRECGVSRKDLQPDAPITWSEVERLSKTELIRFESHGVTHSAMSTLTEEELAHEMRHSRDLVTERSGRPCRHLAYPFGSPRSIGKLAALTAARFYSSATTMTLGSVDRANPWLLPRIPLYPGNSIRFARLKILSRCGPGSLFRGAHIQPESQPESDGAWAEAPRGVSCLRLP
jgi:peptidoglycan/xylan/chitin deacetylase (PgdA/CDA1 family)